MLERFEPITFTALKTAVPDPVGRGGYVACSASEDRGKHLLLGFGDPGAGAGAGGSPSWST